MISRPLVIFTHHYPFGDRELFLETEIIYLAEQFSTIIVVPNEVSGYRRAVPEGVIVETSFAETLKRKSLFDQCTKLCLALRYLPLYKEIVRIPKKKQFLRKLLGYAAEAVRCKKWLAQYLTDHPVLQKAIFYTYWLYDHTSGIGDIKERFPDLSLISRAHGFDLYEEDYDPPYIPFRRDALKQIDKVFCISEHGRNYLEKKYSEFSSSYFIARLGIEDPDIVMKRNPTGSFTIVSCSHLIPLKRLFLQIEGIALFAGSHPEIMIEWKHIGSGPLSDPLHVFAKEQFPSNVRWDFVGHKKNADVFTLYQDWNPHVFMIVSETEGLPVSIMEALSCGIPVIATSVGGIPEIVNQENGILLSSHPSTGEIASALANIFQSEQHPSMQIAARQTWENSLNATLNYRLFVDELAKLT